MSKFNLSNGAKITLKLVIILGLTLVLLIPQILIQDLVRERKNRQREVSHSIGAQVGGAMDVTGPLLVVPYTDRLRVISKADEDKGEGVYIGEDNYAVFGALDLKIKSDTEVGLKKKSIYKIPFFTATATMEGSFETADFSDWPKIKPEDIHWDQAFIMLGINDLKGITDAPVIKWGDQELVVKTGNKSTSIIASGVHADLPEDWREARNFSISLFLRGTNALNFGSNASSAEMTMESNWPDPNFESTQNQGDYLISGDYNYVRTSTLPTEYDIRKDKSGFTAHWVESAFSGNTMNRWLAADYSPVLLDRMMGAEFVNVSSNYKETSRSVKYMFVIIILIFTTFFVAEVLRGNKVHPFQYVLIGISIAVFFVLLIAISEYLSFGQSYLIASAVTILLISWYSSTIFHDRQIPVYIGLLLVALFAFIYIIINATEYSLLFGAIGLFIVLALVMYVTRNVQWYGSEK